MMCFADYRSSDIITKADISTAHVQGQLMVHTQKVPIVRYVKVLNVATFTVPQAGLWARCGFMVAMRDLISAQRKNKQSLLLIQCQVIL
jgi:ABC-type Fe2+-enterobactin transport system substrate-binding protein